MVSTLKLTKIQIPNSDSDVISLDASTGNITLNKTLGGTSVTIQGEGTATTNLQQGLAKHWMRLDGSGTISLLDSLNTSSVTDNGNGIYSPVFTNNMSNANYSVNLTPGVDHGVDFFFACIGDTSGSYTPPSTTGYLSQNCGSAGSTNDTDFLNSTVHGDLA